MLRFIARRLFGAALALWVIVTLSFFLMRFAPGGPFDEERQLAPAAKANRWLAYGMGLELTTPEPAVVVAVADLRLGREYPEGTWLATLRPTAPGAPERRVAMPHDATLEDLPLTAGATLPAGARLAVVPKTGWQQYVDAIGRYLVLDFGVTFSSAGERTVAEEIARALPISLELGLWALAFALLLGVTLGLLAGLRQNTWVDYTAMSGAMLGISIPTMVTGPLLIAVFVLGLGWLPYGGWDPPAGSPWSPFAYRVLPVVTLGLVYAAYFARITRGGMLEVIRADYIRTARAKGLSERQVVLRHALKGALLPTLSFLGPAFARIVTGSVVVERVFGIAGLSEYFVTPALNRDYPLVLGVVVVYSALLLFMNLLVDLAYALLDPRAAVRG